MLDVFYLTAENYCTEPDFQTCRLLSQAKTADGQQLLDVEISPVLPSALAPHDPPISRLILGIANPASELSDVQNGQLVVYIYMPRLGAVEEVYVRKDLRKIGVGGIFPTSQAALDWNSRNKLT